MNWLRRGSTPLIRPTTGGGLLRWVVTVQRRPLLGGVCVAILWMAALALLPAALGVGIDRGVATGEIDAAAPWIAAMVSLGVASGLLGALRHRFAMHLYADTTRMLVERIGDRVLDEGGGLDRMASPGEVVSYADADARQIAAAVDILCRGSGAVAAVILVTVALLQLSVTLGLVVLLGLPPLIGLMVPLWRPLEARSRAAQASIAEAAGLAGDAVVGLRVLKGFGGESPMRARLHDRAGTVRDAAVRVARLDAGWETMRVVVPGALLAALVWMGSQQVVGGTLTPGGLVAAFAYASFLVTPLSTLGEFGRSWARAQAAAARIAELLSTPSSVSRATATAASHRGPGHLVLRRVAAGQDGSAVLDGLDLDVRPGQHLGLVIRDPAAVEALGDILAAHRDPDSGAVLIDGLDCRTLAPARQRQHLLVAEHEAHLFAGTLRQNLDPTATDATLLVATQDAAAGDLVDRLGLDGWLTARGRSLSGGQRQRIAVARALLADPDVLVLDDPTSAVDAHTERAVIAGLSRRRRGRTTLVISQSPVVLVAMDEVAVIRDGRVVDRGTPEEVLTSPTLEPALERPGRGLVG